MKQIEISQELKWEKILKEVKKGDVVLTRQGHAIALMSDFDDEELYWYARERDPAFLASLKRARAQIRKGKGVKHEDLKKQLGIE